MKDIQKVRIIGDGTAIGTKVIDASTGEPVPGFLRRIEFVLDAGGPRQAFAKLTFLAKVEAVDLDGVMGFESQPGD